MAMRRRLAPPRRLASYDPHPHQIVFHRDTHKYRAMVTGVGAGKTRMGAEEILKWTQLYPGCLLVIGRLTAKALRETTQRRFFEVCPPELIEAYNKSEEHLWLKTNAVDGEGAAVYSEILFYHLDEPGPLGSLDISGFWIDEAHEPDGAEVPEETFQMLTARLRHPVGPHRGFVTSNSGGKDWIWKRFFGPDRQAEYIGWTAHTSANSRYLPHGYVEELMRNNPETWVKRFLEASFDAFEGQIFLDFDEDKHCFNSHEVELSPSWNYSAGFDFGVSAPTAAEYACLDRDGVLWVYMEDYVPNADIEEFAGKILHQGFELVSADPSVVNRGPNKRSPKEIYQDHGVCLIPASNDDDFFLATFIKMLRDDKVRISRSCPKLIEQIKAAAWDPKTVTGTTHDKIKKMENHALDAFKYLINGIYTGTGSMDPVNPSRGRGQLRMKEWEHESFLDDEDFDREDYVHRSVKEAVL